MKLLIKRKAAIQSQNKLKNVIKKSSKRKNSTQNNVDNHLTKYKKKNNNEALKAFLIQVDLQRYTDMMHRHIFYHERISKIIAELVVKKLAKLEQDCKKTPQLYQVWEKLCRQFKIILEDEEEESSTESDLSELCNYSNKTRNDPFTKSSEKYIVNAEDNKKTQHKVIDLTEDTIINESSKIVGETKDKQDNLILNVNQNENIAKNSNNFIESTIKKQTLTDQEIVKKNPKIPHVETDLTKTIPKRGNTKKKIDIENQNPADKKTTSKKPKKNSSKNKKSDPQSIFTVKNQTSDLKNNEFISTKPKIIRRRKTKKVDLNSKVVSSPITEHQKTNEDSQEKQIGVDVQVMERRNNSEKTLTYSQIDNKSPSQIFSEIVIDNHDLDMSEQMFDDIVKQSDKLITNTNLESQTFSEELIHSQSQTIEPEIMFNDIVKQSDKLITNTSQESQTFSEELIHSQSQTIQPEIMSRQIFDDIVKQSDKLITNTNLEFQTFSAVLINSQPEIPLSSSQKNEKESQTEIINSDTQINSCIEGFKAINLETHRNQETPKINSDANTTSKLCMTDPLNVLELNTVDFFSQMDSGNEFACYDWLKNINHVHIKDDSYRHELFEVDTGDWSRDFE